MRMAIDAAEKALTVGASPFGATIVRDGEVLACTHNHVLPHHDPTAHGEVTAIREACAKLKTHHLEGATIYSTAEPCPMCFTAIHWARIRRIVFGIAITDVHQYGFQELMIDNATMKREGQSDIELVGPFMAEACRVVFEKFRDAQGQTY